MLKRRLFGIPLPLITGILVILLMLFVIGFMAGPIGPSLLEKLLSLFGLPAITLPEWLNLFSISSPAPELPAEVVLHVVGFPITNSIIGAWVTIIFLVVFSWAVTRRLKVVPGRLQSAFELIINSLYDFCQSVAGEANGRRFFPLVATIFLFVAFNAWLSLIPGFGSIEILNPEGHLVHLIRGPNTDINVPLALALVSFTAVLFFGLKATGFRYLEQYFNVRQFFRSVGQIIRGNLKDGFMGLLLGVIDAFVGVLELLSHLIRVLSLTLRLFGNMTAGEILLLVTAFLIPWLFALPFYGLELLVGFLQALIFAGLTLVFLTIATVGHGEEAH